MLRAQNSSIAASDYLISDSNLGADFSFPENNFEKKDVFILTNTTSDNDFEMIMNLEILEKIKIEIFNVKEKLIKPYNI